MSADPAAAGVARFLGLSLICVSSVRPAAAQLWSDAAAGPEHPQTPAEQDRREQHADPKDHQQNHGNVC